MIVLLRIMSDYKTVNLVILSYIALQRSKLLRSDWTIDYYLSFGGTVLANDQLILAQETCTTSRNKPSYTGPLIRAKLSLDDVCDYHLLHFLARLLSCDY